MAKTGSVTVKIDDALLKERMHGLLADAWEQGFVRASTLLTDDVAAGNHRERNPYRNGDPA